MIITVGPTGRDYTSLTAAEAGQQAVESDFAVIGENVEFVCDGFIDSASAGISFAGWSNASSTQHIIVRPASGAEAGMPWRTTGAYTIPGGASACISVSDGMPRFENFQLDVVAFGFSFQHYGISSGAYFEADGMLVRYVGNASNDALARAFNSAFGGYRARNCVALDFDGSGGGSDRVAFQNGANTGNRVIYNCTAINCLIGVMENATGADVLVKNTLVDSRGLSGAVAFGTTYAAGSDYNASDDATAPGANSRQSQTFTFVDASGGDFHLASTDAGARTYGTDLSADGTWPFASDFDGQARTGSWDIGADQYVAGGGGTTVDILPGPLRAAPRLGGATAASALAVVAAALRAAARATPVRASSTLALGTAPVRFAARLTAVGVTSAIAMRAAPVRGATRLGAVLGSSTLALRAAAVRATLRLTPAELQFIIALALQAGPLRIAARVTSAPLTSSLALQPAAVRAAARVTPAELAYLLALQPAAVRAAGRLAGATVASAIALEPAAVRAVARLVSAVIQDVAGAAGPGVHPLTLEFADLAKTLEFAPLEKELTFADFLKTFELET